jgi:acetylornithine deacetylase/succinyl-diaminopimelate desuccinylase-like protein
MPNDSLPGTVSARAIRRAALVLAAIGAMLAGTPPRARAQAGPPPDARPLARDIFAQLIAINTTHSSGSTTVAAEAMAARLRAAGFPASDVQVLGPDSAHGNLVARYRGRGTRPPLLLLAHLDVVEAHRTDWSVDPFTFLERDGYFYGRGTSDDKAMAAIWITNFILLREQGFVPDRDIIVALTADEEGGDANGVDWLLRTHRDLIDAAYALNEGGGGELKDGKRLLNEIQTSEKVYLSFTLEVRNSGGHSSLPRPDNAIYRLAAGLTRLAAYQFPVRLTETTRAFFQRMAGIAGCAEGAAMRTVAAGDTPDPGAVAELEVDPNYNALMRTTCVATMLAAGHAENALPQTARATVNCRLLPGDVPDSVQATLLRVLADSGISVSPIAPAKPSPASPLLPDVLGAVERVTQAMWPGVPVVPTMVTGATDGLYLRNAGIPTYGVSGLFEEIGDIRAHGRDERMGVEAFYEGREFLERLVKALSSH